MKICVFGTRGFPHVQGGVEKHCECLYPLFPSEYKVTVFRRKPYVNSSEKYDGIEFIDIASTKIKGVETVLHSFLASVICIFKHPDIVHIHNIGPALFSPLLRLFGIKVVLTYHSPNYEHSKWGLFAKLILKASEWIALKTSNAIIFVNHSQMNKYSEKVIAKSHYIPNGISLQTRSKNINLIEELGLKPQSYILSVGRITQEKGFDYLIQAFSNLERNDFKIVIAGGVETESKYYSRLKELISPEKIVFTGYVHGEKLNQLYSNARLFVIPSYNEGFPIVLLEAMNFHLDILASDIPANKAVNLAAESYFKCGDIEDLTQKIHQKLSQPIIDCSYDLSLYDWNKIAEKTTEVYTKLIKKDS